MDGQNSKRIPRVASKRSNSASAKYAFSPRRMESNLHDTLTNAYSFGRRNCATDDKKWRSAIKIMYGNELDQAHSRLRSSWRFYLKAGKSLRFAAESPLDLRLYSPHELVAMLEGSGWRLSAMYDSLINRKPVSSNSQSLAIVAEAA